MTSDQEAPAFVMPAAKAPSYANHLSYRAIDLRRLTPSSNFGSGGGAHYVNTTFTDAGITNVAWQGDVYHYARRIADETSAARVVDIGCGNGLKLQAVFAGSSISICCVDFQQSLAAARKNVSSSAAFIETDLNSWRTDTEVESVLLSTDQPTVVIFSDVIEHLADPRPALMLIRRILALNTKNRLILSTPDRARLNRPSNDSPPQNPAHFREWTLQELADFVGQAGFRVNHGGWVRENEFVETQSTTLLDCSFGGTAQGVKRALDLHSDVTALHVTTEYPGLGRAGGIGTFVLNQQLMTPGSLVLLISPSYETLEFDRECGVIGPASVLLREEITRCPLEDVALLTLQQLCFLLPTLTEVHYQEYSGIGCRIAQASACGLLPTTLLSAVHCHGNVHYLEVSSEKWIEYGSNPIPEKEKIAIECSDVAVFATNFLRDFYLSTGIVLNEETTRVIPYWYKINAHQREKQQLTYSSIDTIVFVGKRSRMKGYDIFLETLTPEMCRTLSAAGIKNISIIGRREDIDDNTDRTFLKTLKRSFSVVEVLDFDVVGLKKYCSAVAGRAIFVAPYRRDNYPIALLDIVSEGGIVITSNTGGIPEMFDAPVWQRYLFSPTPGALGRKLLDVLAEMPDARALANSALVDALERANKKATQSLPSRSRVRQRLSSTVLVPFLDADPFMLDEAIRSLNNQTRLPDEIIFVDDGSSEKYARSCREVIEATCKVPYRIIQHSTNLGLPAARNTALSACRTDVLLNLDADDIALNTWIADSVLALELRPEAAASCGYLRGLEDRDGHWNPSDYMYRPIGEGFIASARENILGHANAAFRTSDLRKIGGWNAATKSKWEDWELYRRILGSGRAISLIPRANILYRVRKQSMARSYPSWGGEERIARVGGTLSAFEAIQLYRRQVSRSRAHRAVDRLIAELAVRPRLRRLALSSGHIALKIGAAVLKARRR